ncbi:SpoIIE family protein phosphatase [Kitasatospora aureofaciens]|uniref:SpoIIE family protein phosphatase n=1 Tax=Kitasatospora aureofaciens TaxID=1894 RepID=UPI001C46107D|nr:SpoIIE family protein phosphatase [Kitasatospora aureofaciens]MBV6698184.1 SpoIIE family protein phosphatase [Kitasatospora aureofaciens]
MVNENERDQGEPRQDGLLMVPIATALVEADGRILHWSGDAEALLGYTAAEALGAKAAKLLTSDERRSEVLELFQRILDGRGWSGVFPVRHRDGHLVDLEFRTHPIIGPGGRPLVLAVAADVTSLRRIQADLAVLDGFFTQSPVGMGVFDPELRFVRLNEALARANGLPAETHLGHRLTELLPGISGAEAEAVMRQVLETGAPVVDTWSHGRTPTDPRHDHAWSASYFRLEAPGGRVLGVSSTVIDITERFRADARAARAQERLALLVDATASIGTTLDLRQTARELAGAMVPRVADISGVFALEALVAGRDVEPPEPNSSPLVRRLALATTDPALYTADILPIDAVYELPPDSPYTRALATGRTVVVSSWELPLLSEGLTESHRWAYIGDRPHAVRITPLVARGTTLGMVVYSRRGARESFAEADITLGDELASRAAVAIDNARLYLRQHQTVLARQQALREAKAAQERLALVNAASARIGTTLDLDRTAQELAEVATPRLADTVVVEVLDDLVRGEREARATADGSALLRRMAFHSVPGSTMQPIARPGGVHRFLPGSPYAWCLANRKPVLVPRMDEAGMAWFADDPVRTAAVREQNVRSFMVVPLIARGTPIGVAGFYRTLVEHPYEDADLALAGELAVRAAVSIDNALLFTREHDAAAARQRALDEARAAQQRLSLLNEASKRIGTTLDLHRTARELVEMVIPRFADFVTVDLRDAVLGGEEPGPVPADGSVLMRAVAIGEASADATMTGAADEVGETSQSAEIYAESLRTGRSILVSEVTEAELRRIVASPDRVQPGLDAGIHSYLMVPLVARGLVLGGAEFVRTRNPAAFGQADRSLAEELAARTALAIDNGRLYRRERDTALTLQRSLLPQEIHRTLGLEIAYRYLPSSVVSEVGGDWFDVVPLSSERVALIVGDVMGHGIRAAATMGQLRTVARTLITLDLDPERVLYRLDEATTAIGEGQFATCVCVVFDPVDRRCAAACAGHLPPVVADPEGGARLVGLPPGAPLGVGGVPFESVEFTLPEDAILALYTDGLVERRGHDIDEGLRLLCRTVADRRRSLEQTCDAVLAELTGRTSEDDIAVIMAQVRPVGTDRIATLPLTGDHAMVGHSRRFTRKTLTAWGLETLADWAELLTSELITNALVHAGSPTQLRLFCSRLLTVEVADRESEAPRIRRARAEDEGGRGMHLVNELAHRWGSRRTKDGKVVWFELELPPGSSPP